MLFAEVMRAVLFMNRPAATLVEFLQVHNPLSCGCAADFAGVDDTQVPGVWPVHIHTLTRE